jgi:archaellum biogenesis ATPase FlaH
MSCCELTWAAGLFEGEGYICIVSKAGTRGYINNSWRIGVEMTDKDVVEHFAKVFNLNVKFKPRSHKNPKWKDLYVAQVSHQAKVKEIVDALLPFMGERRRSKMEEFLGDFKAQCS